jgi:hypothetical protein
MFIFLTNNGHDTNKWSTEMKFHLIPSLNRTVYVRATTPCLHLTFSAFCQLPYFDKIDLCDYLRGNHAASANPLSTSECMSQCLRNLVHHSTWTHLSGVHHKSLQSVCVSLLPLLSNGSVNCIPCFIPRERLGRHVPAATNIRNSNTVRRAVFSAIRASWKENLCIPYCC